MIKNDHQYRVTRSQLERFQGAMADLQARPTRPEEESRRALERAAVEAQISELAVQLEEYELLKAGDVSLSPLRSLDELPDLLIRARIAQGMSQRDLAERLGMKEQQIQRYEANDWATASLGRLIEVADVLDLKLDPSLHEAPAGLNSESLVKQLVKAGLERSFVRQRLAPPGAIDAAAAPSTDAGSMLELAARVSRIFGWSPSQLLKGNLPKVRLSPRLAVSFKLPSQASDTRVKAYTVYSRHLAHLVLQATPHLAVRPVPDSAAAFRAAILSTKGSLDFESVLAFTWALGIPVLPLIDPGGFHAALWRLGGRNVIVLKQKDRQASRWLFDLLHEVKHASEVPEVDEHVVIDFEEEASSLEAETRANTFAGDVLLDGRAEELAMASVQAAHGSVERLKSVVPGIARRAGLNVGDLANYLAHRLSLQKDPFSGRKINWWGVARNLQPTETDPWESAREFLLQEADLTALDAIDRGLLSQALIAPME